MLETKEKNAIILIKNGEQKNIKLPSHGEFLIKVTNGMPTQIEKMIEKQRFEDL